MSIIDLLPLQTRHDKHNTIPSPDAPATEWITQMEEWRDLVIQAEVAFHNTHEDSDAYTEYGDTISEIDNGVGEYAEHIAKEPAATFDERGESKDNGTFWNPGERFILLHAVEIFDHTRTENSRALVEALLDKYADKKWWPITEAYKKEYEAILSQQKELGSAAPTQ